MESYDVIICGSGPAGLAAGLAAASHGAATLILERDYAIGRKLCATGNGRCNFSNTLHPLKFMAEFGRNGRFMIDALRAAPREFFLELLLQEGIRPKVENEIHYFPLNGRASDVRDAFLRAAKKAGAETRSSVGVRRVLAEDWGMELELDRDARDAAYIGIRMHDLTPDETENSFRCRLVEEIENPFSFTLMLRRVDRPDAAPVGWETDKETWNRLRAEELTIALPKRGLLLLKE